MNLFKQLLLAGALIGTASQLQAQQKDFVILTGTDTLHCEINTPFMGSKNYKTNPSGEKIKITPESVKEYFVARKNVHERAVFKNGKTEPMFMSVVERGKISLYEVVYRNYGANGISSTTTEWYMSKNSDTVTALKTSGLFFLSKSKQQRMDNFKDMIADNKEVLDKYLADDKFNFKQLAGLVHLYNTGKPLSNEPEKKEDPLKKDDAY